MLNDILMLYMQSLLITVILVTVVAVLCLGWWVSRRRDRGIQERRAYLYDVMMTGIITTPVLSFAVMGIILMTRA